MSQLRSDDSALIDTVEVDQALAPLGLRRVDGLRMLSRFDAETVYWGLSDERYPVVLEDDEREPLRSPSDEGRAGSRRPRPPIPWPISSSGWRQPAAAAPKTPTARGSPASSTPPSRPG
ncbi:hypothetical protein GCM10025867_15550 [Frondihabitans sucicola]|uniref:Uncharacterized protein n=1 Tax=Frondihabitans sucicola TaxID=1268041 RepID=A0ABN6XWQ8_9MICO|nr:hypothetical protein GCM10025867_15550 [Frondihabitans sucicola]